ncbi:MAG: dTDP-glucose 4,6-dehydratase [bacterium]
MRILVTGGAGFIGSNFILYMLEHHPDYDIINLDKLTYAGNLENLKSVDTNRHYTFVKGDIADAGLVTEIMQKGIDAIVNFAAESHVDRSILEPASFIKTNVLGTQVLLDVAREKHVSRFIQISTDEVYGSLGETGKFTETTCLHPNSPYSASKASADMIALAYYKTFNVPVIVTRTSNNYGPYQFPEKLLPLAITNLLEDKPVPIYGDGLNVRDWIYVADNARAIDLVLHRGNIGEVYNIGAGNESTNISLIKHLLKLMNKPESLIIYVKDRPGHDRRYAIDASKIMNTLGWKPSVALEEGLRLTIDWYVNNRDWWTRIKSGEYLEYYEKNYLPKGLKI